MKLKHYSTLEYVLLALVPYSRPNTLLAFKPKQFFDELQRTTGASRASLQSTLTRAKRQGYIESTSPTPILTVLGHERTQPYTAKILRKEVSLMVAFDIPEELAGHRRKLRYFLRCRNFTQVQKSMWTTDLDYRKELAKIIQTLELEPYVALYECARINV